METTSCFSIRLCQGNFGPEKFRANATQGIVQENDRFRQETDTLEKEISRLRKANGTVLRALDYQRGISSTGDDVVNNDTQNIKEIPKDDVNQVTDRFIDV
jgi:hypothetical protein